MLTLDDTFDLAFRTMEKATDAAECFLRRGSHAVGNALANDGLKAADTGAALAAFMAVAQQEYARMLSDDRDAADRAKLTTR